MKTLDEKFKEIDALIRAAHWERAQKKLIVLRRRAIKRADALTYATLCRKADLAGLGVLTLRSFLRSSSRKRVSDATSAEKTEYAACLLRLGALQEARNLLCEIKEEPSAFVLWLQASSLVKEWDYESAISYLRKYVNHPQLSSYERCIGHLNLGMCLLYEEHTKEAGSLLMAVLESEDFQKNPLIAGNTYRLLGLIEYQKAEYSLALEFFDKALKSFLPSVGLERFLVHKWISITNFAIHKGDENSTKELEEVRRQAKELRHWESLRDIDYQSAIHVYNPQKLLRIYFGTPFKHYRRKIENRFPQLEIPSSYLWRPSGGEIKPNDPVFELRNSDLKPGHALFRLLGVLFSDFYRPFSLVLLFNKLFPGEFYRYESSEQKVAQTLTRGRKWLESSKLPLKIVTNKNEISLIETRAISISVTLEESEASQVEYRWKEIEKTLGKEFTAKTAAELLGVSKRTLLKTLSKGIDSGRLIRKGEGMSTVYQFAQPEAPSKKAA